MLSLNNIIEKFPKDWVQLAQIERIDVKEILEIYKSLEIEGDTLIKLAYDAASLVEDMYLVALKKEDKCIGLHLLLFSILLDDVLDREGSNRNNINVQECKSNLIGIFTYGYKSGSLSNIEKIAIYFNRELERVCGERTTLLHLIRSSIIEFIDSFLPFHQLKEMNKMHLDIYLMVRNVNVEFKPIYYSSVLLATEMITGEIFLDPLWARLSAAYNTIGSLCNDIVSYDKEIRDKEEHLNPFHFYQIVNKVSKEEALKFFESEIDRLLDECFKLEKQFISKYEPKCQNIQELEELNKIIKVLHCITGGHVKWLLNSKRYKTPNPTFKELILI